MSIFNSLGSNYDSSFVFKALSTYNGSPKDLKKLLEKKYKGKAILTFKGREALELALKNLQLPEGSFVAINGFTCFAVYEAIKKAGLNVQYLDIEKGDLNFSPRILENKLKKNPKIKVVIIQNTLGYPCKIEKISEICQENNLILIEDLAHSVGTRYSNGFNAGEVGNMAVFSFSQDKIIDGISGGALIVRKGQLPNQPTSSPGKQIIYRLYPLFTYLIRKTYQTNFGKILHFSLKNLGLLSGPMNSSGKIHKLPDWYCQLVIEQFETLRESLTHRRKIARIYAKLLNPSVTSKKILNLMIFSPNLRFPIFVQKRDRLIQYLARNHVFISDIWYDAPIAPRKYLEKTDYMDQCPNAELTSTEILNLPTHRNITPENAKKIVSLINKWLKSK